MKTLKLLPTLLLLAVAGTLRGEISAPAWLETYYLNPEPAALAPRLHALSREGFFERPGHTALAIGFIATLFAQHPARIEGWLRECGDLPPAHQRLLAAALWQAGHDAAADVLRLMSLDSPVRNEVLRLADIPAQLIVDTPVRSASSLHLQWGAFLATGSERHVQRILDAIVAEAPQLELAARLAFARDVAVHPRAREICRERIVRESPENRPPLEAVLSFGGPSA